MIHELKEIVEKAHSCYRDWERCVLATVVALDGSSYRKPGVRMLITRSGEMVGAVSGGCVEKNVQQRAQEVFETGEPLVMTYDGRFRLGCEGILYILLEPFEVNEALYKAFHQHLEQRLPVQLSSYYQKEDQAKGPFGTLIKLQGTERSFTECTPVAEGCLAFEQELEPFFKLVLLGAEHDAVKLCTMASKLGWEVEVYSGWRNPKEPKDFPEASAVHAISPEMLDASAFDNRTAVVLMTHNYALDLKYLLQLQKAEMAYLGVLGSGRRSDQLRAELFEYTEAFDLAEFHGPLGLDIGAQTPEEIAVSIIAEILSVTRNKEQQSLSTHKIKVSL